MSAPNRLFFGDNLDVLRNREYFPDASVDLVYLDPPFNSKRDYNLLFKSPKGHQSEAQITAFEDTWHWTTDEGSQAEAEFNQLLSQPNTQIAQVMQALRSFLGENDLMAYLTMMANRLLELHRVLKPTGSLYLHCDPTASHYLKVVLDAVFGKEQFLSEVIWKRTGTHSSANRWGPVHDTILFYAKSNSHLWNRQYVPLEDDHRTRHYRHVDAHGRRYAHGELTAPGTRNGRSGAVWKGFDVTGLGRHWMTTVEKLDAMYEAGRIYLPDDGSWPRLVRYEDEASGGRAVGDTWVDISPINMMAAERLGYPTQKPLALLERIIAASSNEGDVVLDPFCGCGTAVHAAQKLKRRWAGIDITHLAIELIEKRLTAAFGADCKFVVDGRPEDLAGAANLAERNKYQFQWWAVWLVGGQSYQGKKKGADGGIDGLKFFHDLHATEARKIVLSVKGGKLKIDDVRALAAVRKAEGAEIAALLSLDKPTPKMREFAAAEGLYDGGPHGTKSYPRVQLLTIEGLMADSQRLEHPDYTPDVNFKKAKREKPRAGDLFGDADPG